MLPTLSLTTAPGTGPSRTGRQIRPAEPAGAASSPPGMSGWLPGCSSSVARYVTRPIDEQSHTGDCQYSLLLIPRSAVDCPRRGPYARRVPSPVTEPDAGFGI